MSADQNDSERIAAMDLEFEGMVNRKQFEYLATEEAKRRIREQQSAGADRHARLMAGGDFVLDEPEQIPAIWGEGERVLWAEGEALMLLAEQGLGKTTIAQQLALAMTGVRGENLLGLPVRHFDGPVLYLAMDRPRQAARSLFRMVSAADRVRLNERLAVWRGPLPINATSSPEVFADWAQGLVPGVRAIIADSVKDFVPGIVKDEVGAALNLAWQEVIARNIELLLLHHPRKQGGDDTTRKPSLDSAYGSTWITAGLGSVIQIIGKRGDTEVKLHHVKQPAEVVGPLTVQHDHASGTSRRAIGSVEDFLIVSAMSGETFTVVQVAEALGLSEKVARTRLESLVEMGRAEKYDATQTASGRTPAQYRWKSPVAGDPAPGWD